MLPRFTFTPAFRHKYQSDALCDYRVWRGDIRQRWRVVRALTTTRLVASKRAGSNNPSASSPAPPATETRASLFSPARFSVMREHRVKINYLRTRGDIAQAVRLEA